MVVRPTDDEMGGAMTQQYIRGELSLRLEELRDERFAGPAHALLDLRHRVEEAPADDLPELAGEAMEVVDVACWASLDQGDLDAFERECRDGASLREFAMCAGLLS